MTVERQLTESCRDGRHTVFCHFALFGQRGKPGLSQRKPWEPYDGKISVWMLCNAESVAMLQYCMLTCYDFIDV